MEELELEYENLTAVPEPFRKLYKEDETAGKAVLVGVKGLKTQKDVDTVMESLRKERKDHSAIKLQINAWGDLKPDEVKAQLEELPTLRLAAEGKLDDQKIKDMIEPKVAQATGPLNRQITTLTTERDERDKTIAQLQSQIESRDRNDVIREAAKKSKVHDSAVADIELLAGSVFEKDATTGKFVTKDGLSSLGITAGISPDQFLKDMQKSRPHWWPASEGGGAGGGGGRGNGGFGGANPWSKDGWNMTEQAKIYKEQGEEVAKRMAIAGGTVLGGLRPTK